MLSIWEKESFYKPVDVLIIGSGLMGLWTAYELKCRQPGLDVLVIERSSIPEGASTRNAGFACMGSPGELLRNAATMGDAAMVDIVAGRFRGINKMRHVLGDEAIGYDACGGFECIDKSFPDFNMLPDKIAWLNKLLWEVTGSQQTYQLNADGLRRNGLSGFETMVETRFEGAVHSGQLLQSLLGLVRSKGVRIRMGEEVTNWEKDGAGICVSLKDQQQVTSKLLVATNGFMNQLVPASGVEPARGQVLVTRPIEGLQLRGTFHYQEGFYYWRRVGDRVLLGGARNVDIDKENTELLELSETVQAALVDFLQEHILQGYHLPVEGLVEQRWAGLMGFTSDRKPRVQSLGDNAWSALSCNGMGVALTPILAEQVADAILNS